MKKDSRTVPSKEKLVNILILCVLFMGAYARIRIYGDLRLSIGILDTTSFIKSSQAPLLSWRSFTGRRLFTANILYKVANNEQECRLTATSFPALGKEGNRVLQPCFYKIALIQNVFSILGWCLLAWTTARWIKNPLYKTGIAILILAFGFTPQIAEWDSVLSSESLSISLYAIGLALLLEIANQVSNGIERVRSVDIGILVSVWLFFFALWVFVRDVHLYAIPITIALIIPLLFISHIRQSMLMLATAAILIGLFIIGNVSAHQSSRWQPSLEHILNQYVFPFPPRVDFFKEHGMPDPSSVVDYDKWFNSAGLKTYARFLVSHPGFVTTTLLEQAPLFKFDSNQPYFNTNKIRFRDIFLIIGEVLHPETYSVYIIDFLLFLSLLVISIKHRGISTYGWTWVAAWIFLYSTASLIISFFGDTDGLRRHIFPSVESFRLFCWIFLIVNLDLLAEERQPASNQSLPL